jgi:uncharacterized protein with HEPN domain
MKDEFLDYVEDILKAMDDALTFVKDMNYDAFVKDRKTIYAVIRALEIIGEATKNIPSNKDSLPRNSLERHGWNARQGYSCIFWG